MHFSAWRRAVHYWDQVFFKPGDTTPCAVLRIAFCLVLLPYVTVLGLDLPVFHGETGLMPFETSVSLIDPDVLSPLGWLAPNDALLWFCYWLFVIQTLLLLLGVKCRIQALCVFFWLVAFQHRHNLLLDGGDTLARLIAFYLFCMPCGERFSIDAWLKKRKGEGMPRKRPLWGLRLVRIQMIFLYLSTALSKAGGGKWLDGSAMVYVVQLHDLFGRFPLPSLLTTSLPVLHFLTWLVLVVEFLIPLGLCFKQSRMVTVPAAVLFHLAIDYSMNLYLFQWFMIVGLLSFIDWSGFKVSRRNETGGKALSG